MVARKDAAVLKVHASLQRAAGRWPFHALSAGEFSQKPSGFTPFVPMSPCPRSALADIPNMKIFHILQDNLLVPEIVRIWESAQDTKNSSQGPLEALHHLSLRWPATQ